MAQVVEINLRLPSLRMKATEGAEAKNIVNSEVRFTKEVALDTIPKPGDILTMSAGSGQTFPCEVVQANWHDARNIFVIACRYGKRTVSTDDYLEIVNSPDWTSKPLL
jgi:hypothetical protein